MFSFVVLHYKNISDTIECLQSIKKLKHQEEISIIVVDNNTLDKNEYNKLKKYTPDIIELQTNMGFAKANNIGCKYAIKKYNPNFIAVINNDTLVSDIDFIEKIKQLYNKYHFDAYGPFIISDGDSVNPFKTYDTLEEIKKEIRKCKFGLIITKYNVIYRLYNAIIKIKHKILPSRKIKFENGKEDALGVGLHGCFIVFSKKYINKFNDIFYNDTFLYHEEEFLTYRRDKYNLKFLYSPIIKIVHKEGKSTSSMNMNDKKYFYYKERLKSLNKLKDVKEK